MNAQWKNQLANKSSGHRPGPPKGRQPGSVATRHALSKGQEQMMTGLSSRPALRLFQRLSSQQSKAPATLQDFLAQTGAADLQDDGAIRAAMAQLHLEEEDPVVLRGTALLIDHDAIRVTSDVVAALIGAPEGEQSGVTAAELSSQNGQRCAILVLDGTLGWAAGQVKIGKSILETWQSEAQQVIAGALWEALVAAPNQVERMALVKDAGEVFAFEAKLLEQSVASQQAAAVKLGHLQSQIDATSQEVLFLKTMQDLRAGRPVPDEVLREMSQYYAERGDAPPTEAAAPATRRQTSRAT